MLSAARPYCDLRHRIFLSEVNLGFKEFLAQLVALADRNGVEMTRCADDDPLPGATARSHGVISIASLGAID
jgi:hypothetical protein